MRANGVLAAVMMLAMAGCAANATDDTEDMSGDEVRSNAWQDLVGSYSSANAGDAEFSSITFEVKASRTGHSYFAESVGTLVSCHTGSGCTTSHQREDGYYTATSTHVTLHPAGGGTRVYTYRKTDTQLVMTRSGVHNTYSVVTSNCDTTQDCEDEGLIHPLCWIGPGGGWACGADHSCAYRCGSPGATAGQTCGGIANIQCAAGLECHYANGSGPSYPDEGGTCQAVPTGAGVGETCGGIAAIQCSAGLACWYSNGSAPSYPDEGGTCRTAAHRGESCGGFTRAPAVCVDGSTCVANRTNPDLPGTCR